VSEIHAGDAVIITDTAENDWETTALADPVRAAHDRWIVWVNRPLYAGGFEPMPWPLEAVRKATTT
jgi:hypothetical protein